MDKRSPEAEESARRWLDRAELDADNARSLYDSFPSAYDNVGFLCQQAIEKLVKAFLISHSQDYPKTHDIRTLLIAHVEAIDAELAVEARFADELTPYAVAARYPAGFDPVSRETAERLIRIMERAWDLFGPRILETLSQSKKANQSAELEDTPKDAADSDV